MKLDSLIRQIHKKRSFLCVGLDTDLSKIPEHLLDSEDPIFEFNKTVIDATADLCVAYKPNMAFYEAQGHLGIRSLEKTLEYIPNEHFTICDAKRGDIGNTSKKYAEAYFTKMNFDSITVSPYMGLDAVTPYLEYTDKFAIVLGLTSNSSAGDVQLPVLENRQQMYEHTISTFSKVGSIHNMMFVVGATQADSLRKIRSIIPDHFLLVPGVGAQGGSLSEVFKNGVNDNVGLLVNSSRGIIYAGGQSTSFQNDVRDAANALQSQMEVLLATL